VKPPTDFGREEALALQAILESPSRPADTLHYFEAAGFLFAVCVNPDLVQPSEWIPEVLGKSHGDIVDFDEAKKTLDLLMGLYNQVNQGVLERRAALPWGCEVREDAMSNLDEDAPLARWSRGFSQGYGWLQKSWPDDLSSELSQGLSSCLIVLTFFSKRSLAEAYWKQARESGYSLEVMAGKMQEMLLPTMAAFADLGRHLYESSLGHKAGSESTRRTKRKSTKTRR
jgi:yecA family protein